MSDATTTPRRADVAGQLHDAVMRLRDNYEDDREPLPDYALGHRDAREAAAELVLTSDALRKLEADRDALARVLRGLLYLLPIEIVSMRDPRYRAINDLRDEGRGVLKVVET